MIIGAGGAGKSWLARRLGDATGLPVIHLDREYWRPGWIATPGDAWRANVLELVARERWILDGNYGGTMELRMRRADTIVFLDVPRWRSVAGVLARRVRNDRIDVGPGCPERLSFEFLRWIWEYPAKRRPEILARIARHRDARAIVLRDRAAMRRFLDRTRAAT